MKKIIAIAGRKGAGKDTIAEVLTDKGFVVVKFAGALKTMFRAYLQYVGAGEYIIERMIEGDLKEVPSPLLQGKTPRFFMQRLGTEFGRDMIGDDLWVDALEHHCSTIPDDIAITDMRFPNEGDKAGDMGAEKWRVRRPSIKLDDTSDHPSETAIDDLEVDVDFLNVGSIEDLKNLAEDTLNE